MTAGLHFERRSPDHLASVYVVAVNVIDATACGHALRVRAAVVENVTGRRYIVVAFDIALCSA